MEKRILLVDDESSLRRTLSVGMSQEGYDVEPCENGINALKKLYQYKKSGVDLETVVLDIKLPDIDGIKLGKIIRSQYPDTGIIFITGYSDKMNIQEINSISSTGFLEKPFSSGDLTYKIEELAKAKAAVINTSVARPKEIVKTYSAYILLRIAKNADFFGIYQKLYFDPQVLYCDATQGDYDVFLLIQASGTEECKTYCEKKIRTIPGIEELDFLPVSNPVLDDSLYNIIQSTEKVFSNDSNGNQKRDFGKRICSYILLQVEREKMDSIYPTLCVEEKVVYCDFTGGKYNLVLLVQGSSFNEIDDLIENKIVNMEGILKVKEFPILNIYEM
jgi:CheY-like chemotaxis protein